MSKSFSCCRCVLPWLSRGIGFLASRDCKLNFALPKASHWHLSRLKKCYFQLLSGLRIDRRWNGTVGVFGLIFSPFAATTSYFLFTHNHLYCFCTGQVNPSVFSYVSKPFYWPKSSNRFKYEIVSRVWQLGVITVQFVFLDTIWLSSIFGNCKWCCLFGPAESPSLFTFWFWSLLLSRPD